MLFWSQAYWWCFTVLLFSLQAFAIPQDRLNDFIQKQRAILDPTSPYVSINSVPGAVDRLTAAHWEMKSGEVRSMIRGVLIDAHVQRMVLLNDIARAQAQIDDFNGRSFVSRLFGTRPDPHPQADRLEEIFIEVSIVDLGIQRMAHHISEQESEILSTIFILYLDEIAQIAEVLPTSSAFGDFVMVNTQTLARLKSPHFDRVIDFGRTVLKSNNENSSEALPAIISMLSRCRSRVSRCADFLIEIYQTAPSNGKIDSLAILAALSALNDRAARDLVFQHLFYWSPSNIVWNGFLNLYPWLFRDAELYRTGKLEAPDLVGVQYAWDSWDLYHVDSDDIFVASLENTGTELVGLEELMDVFQDGFPESALAETMTPELLRKNSARLMGLICRRVFESNNNGYLVDYCKNHVKSFLEWVVNTDQIDVEPSKEVREQAEESLDLLGAAMLSKK